jgi:hypothetical protein
VRDFDPESLENMADDLDRLVGYPDKGGRPDPAAAALREYAAVLRFWDNEYGPDNAREHRAAVLHYAERLAKP